MQMEVQEKCTYTLYVRSDEEAKKVRSAGERDRGNYWRIMSAERIKPRLTAFHYLRVPSAVIDRGSSPQYSVSPLYFPTGSPTTWCVLTVQLQHGMVLLTLGSKAAAQVISNSGHEDMIVGSGSSQHALRSLD